MPSEICRSATPVNHIAIEQLDALCHSEEDALRDSEERSKTGVVAVHLHHHRVDENLRDVLEAQMHDEDVLIQFLRFPEDDRLKDEQKGADARDANESLKHDRVLVVRKLQVTLHVGAANGHPVEHAIEKVDCESESCKSGIVA